MKTEIVLWATKKGDEKWKEQLITSSSDLNHIAKAEKWAIENGFDRIRKSTFCGEKPEFSKSI